MPGTDEDSEFERLFKEFELVSKTSNSISQSYDVVDDHMNSQKTLGSRPIRRKVTDVDYDSDDESDEEITIFLKSRATRKVDSWTGRGVNSDRTIKTSNSFGIDIQDNLNRTSSKCVFFMSLSNIRKN